MDYTIRASKAQEEYCKKNKLPYFAPPRGICPSCRQVIYAKSVISIEKAGSQLITGCPYCHYSFLD